MLAGQNAIVRPNSRTDPAIVARWNTIPQRNDGVPPIQGNGKGEGAIGFHGDDG
jgi:hypothetical protein